MTTRSFLSVVAQLNEAQAEVVRSIGFASFFKVDLKQIPGKFFKWPVESFDQYAVYFRRPNGQKFSVTAFDVYVTLGIPFGGSEIIEITKSSTDQEYDEVHAAWLKEWKIEQNAPELTQMLGFILAKQDGDASVIIEKEDHCKDVVLDQLNKFMKKDDSIPSYSLGLGLSQPDSQSRIPQITSVPDPNTAGVNEDDGSEDDDDGAPLRFLLRTLLS
ncbi:hypothetical protein Cgig2_024282 [Carnegiea gigantea]|uniref:Uncharacterized protein n=1 Tax=Carnegiea gigantea TaxID=171969 RepID=A0A9Q1JHL1_9CARY|nr:hypothetical protein Cgig2_024282 [Carnegiea gigantea]